MELLTGLGHLYSTQPLPLLLATSTISLIRGLPSLSFMSIRCRPTILGLLPCANATPFKSYTKMYRSRSWKVGLLRSENAAKAFSLPSDLIRAAAFLTMETASSAVPLSAASAPLDHVKMLRLTATAPNNVFIYISSNKVDRVDQAQEASVFRALLIA